MSDTIQLDQHFPMSPVVAMKEHRRAMSVARHFALLADDPNTVDPISCARIRDEYLTRAKRLRQIAQPTAPRLSDMAV